MTLQGERIDQGIVASVLLHGALFSFVILSPKIFPAFSTNWGSAKGGTGGISVKIVSESSSIPLPTPIAVSETAPANDSPGLYKNEEPAPAPPPDKAAEPIPETKMIKPKAPPKPAPAKPAAPKSATPPEPTPSNAIPYGQGGRPALSYGQFSTGAGEAGIGFGDAAFGDRYSTYVNAVTRAISNNWLKSLVDARVQKAPRVYVSFEILRDGTISGAELKQSSGIPSLDRSALRAVNNSTLPALPSDYRGNSVSVSFYFEYSR